MGEQSEDLARHIEDRRIRLNANIGELERKAKDVLDWRVQVEQRPGMMLGLAFGAGVLLSAIIGGAGRSPRRKAASRSDSHRASTRETGRPYAQSTPDAASEENVVSHAWDNMKGALVGVAVTKCESFLEELLPGITDQYHKAEGRNSLNTMGSSSQKVN